jgi:FimV-like protein
MHKGSLVSRLLLILVSLLALPVQAKLNHVSINSRQFELGQYPQLKINIVSEQSEAAGLAFYVKQRQGNEDLLEKLMVQPINNYLLMVTGTENVTDKNAQLVVKKYRRNTWHTYLELALFSAPLSKNSANLARSPAITQSMDSVKAQAAQNAASSVTALVNRNLASNNETRKAKKNPAEVQANEPDITQQSSNNIQHKAQEAEQEASSTDTAAVVPAQAKGICTLPYTQGETLWRIASHYALSWQINVYGAMLAIYNTNPKAFADEDVQGLMKGAVLICPTGKELSQYRDKTIDELKFEIQVAKAQLKRENRAKETIEKVIETAE